MNIKVDDRGYASMDQLMELLRSLPVVQQAIVHTHLTDTMLEHPYNANRGGQAFEQQMNNLRANWMYAPVDRISQP